MPGKYKDPILERIKKVLNEHGPAELKGRYGIGDPGVVNKSQLSKPMAFISYENINIAVDTNAEDKSSLPIVIDVVYDMTKDFGQGLNAFSHLSVVEYVYAQNPDFTIKDDCIVGVLREHSDLTENEDSIQLFLDLQEPMRVEFDYQNRDKGLVTAEAVVHFTVSKNQLFM